MFRTALSLVVCSSLIAAFGTVVGAQGRAATTAAAKAVVPSVLNINTASAAELDTLPGIGAKTAALIVEYRQKNGPFKKVEELMNVRGIGEKNFLKLKPLLSIGPAKTDHDHQDQQ
jgi:competence protein ComEA